MGMQISTTDTVATVSVAASGSSTWVGDLAEALVGLLAQPGLKALVLNLRCTDPSTPFEQSVAVDLARSIAMAPVPIAAAVHGVCGGAPLLISLACHARFMADDASLKFAGGPDDPVAAYGPELFGCEISRTVAGLAAARTFSEEQARAEGMVREHVDTADPCAAAQAYLTRLTARRPPRLIRTAMASVAFARANAPETALEHEHTLFTGLATMTLGGGAGEEGSP